LCPSCSTDAVPWPEDFCMRCGSPQRHKGVCRSRSTESRDPIHISWLYEGAIAQAIVRAKRGQDIAQAVNLVPLAFQNHPPAEFFFRLDAVVPVPPNGSRLAHSGYDLVSEISSFVARALSVPLAHRWLHRRKGPGLKGHSRVERIETARQLYSLRVRREAFRDTRVLLVDDVRTTGATTDTIAKLLRRAGCSEVRIWALSGSASLSQETSANHLSYGRHPWHQEA